MGFIFVGNGGDMSRRSPFFLVMAWVFLGIAVLGFSSTFFLPLVRGDNAAPRVVMVHGLLFFAWLVFFIAQCTWVQSRRLTVHRRMGSVGALLALSMVISGGMVGLHATQRDLLAGGGDLVLGQFVNILIEMLLFGGLVAAAVLFRHDGQTHKRLMLLATISALAPAWLRLRHLFPAVPHPFISFSLMADSLLLFAMAHDWLLHRRVHPAYLWAGGGMVGVHLVELFAMTSPPWLAVARWLLG